MEVLLFEQDVYERDFNCSLYDVDEVPFEQRQHKFLGILFIILFFVFQILYIPVMMALRSPKLASHSCYKLMFFIGLIDVVGLTWSGLVSGMLCLLGTVFCSFPVLNFVLGTIALMAWSAASDTSILLALNRCVAMYDFNLHQTLFRGRRLYIWMSFVAAHVFLLAWVCKPATFNSLFTTWLVFPHAGYMQESGASYLHPLHFSHNIFVATSYILLYSSFLLLYTVYQKRLTAGISNLERSDPHTEVFLQVLISCSVNFACAVLYILMQFVPVSKWMIITAEFLWLLTHGLPAIVYLTLNKSVRSIARRHITHFHRIGSRSSISISI